MGKWGAGVFDNDESLDWLDKFVVSDDPTKEILKVFGKEHAHISMEEISEAEMEFQQFIIEMIEKGSEYYDEGELVTLENVNEYAKKMVGNEVQKEAKGNRWIILAACESVMAILGSPSEHYTSVVGKELVEKLTNISKIQNEEIARLIPLCENALENLDERARKSNDNKFRDAVSTVQKRLKKLRS